MHQLDIYQVDAFASGLFRGNPAAVCPLESWLPDEILQAIAEENNLAETAFYVKEDVDVIACVGSRRRLKLTCAGTRL